MHKVRGRVVGEAKDTSLEDATFRLPDGREKVVAIVHRPAAVGVLPLRVAADGGLEVLLARQPRPAVGEEALVEVVAGKVEEEEDVYEAGGVEYVERRDESPLATAQRELAEEVGLAAHGWVDLALDLLPSPGFLDERIHLFACWGLTTVESREEDAHITGEWISLQEAIQMVRKIRDMKTIIALLLVDKHHHKWQIA